MAMMKKKKAKMAESKMAAAPVKLAQSNQLWDHDDGMEDLYGNQTRGLVQFEDLEATKEYRETHYRDTASAGPFSYKFSNSRT